jgi:hypothetical protein
MGCQKGLDMSVPNLKYEVIISVPKRDPIRLVPATPFMGFSVGNNIVGGILSEGEHVEEYGNLRIISIKHMFHVSKIEIDNQGKEQLYHRIDIEADVVAD